SSVPGERTSPTQPIPTRPAPFERQGSLEENLIDFTPELRAEARQILGQYDHGELFTPPTERGTINLPGSGGGGNWWGAAFDPQTGLFYVPSTYRPIVVKLVKPDPARSNFNYVRGGGGYPAGPRGLPLFKPPYGRITAIDLNRGEQSWMVPHGDGLRTTVNAVVKTITGKETDFGPLGAGGGTGPLLTRTLLFVGQGSTGDDDDYRLRAYNKATGRTVAEIHLPEHPTGTPMTYLAGGKQYLVVATVTGRLIALALP
ncbi:MAG TPA: pyrroloquinoline quinone-dependent dehydrogenase, partial [Blastocatellia bacterium]|nr:pyrroloquinoline quinone-dependent dehydrogenase [Blastocatellia bacterium]